MLAAGADPTAIERHLKLVMFAWMVIIAAGWIFGRLGRKIGQPLAVGEITAGLLLGPSALGALWPESLAFFREPAMQQSLQLLGKIGLILLLFQVGMEFDYSHLRAHSKTVTATALMGLAAPAVIGTLLAQWLHGHFAPHTDRLGFTLFVCIALAITALPIMGRILLEMGLEKTALGALAISAAAIDDVAGWIGLAVITALAKSSFDMTATLLQLGGVLALFAALLWIVAPLIRRFWRWSGGGAQMPAAFLAVLLITLFASCIAANALGVFSIFGAFLFGVSLHAQRDLVKAWRERYYGLVLVAFVPIFFTNTGLRADIGSIGGAFGWLACGLIMIAAVLSKLGGCYLGARLTGCPVRESFSIATLMNTRALMALVAITVGLDLGLLPPDLYTMFVIMALLTTAMTGPLLRLGLPHDLRRLVTEADKTRD